MDFLEIGLITKPHGVRGQVKIKPLDFGHFDFLAAKTLNVGGTDYAVLEIFSNNGEFVATLAGVDSVQKANALKNKAVCVARSEVNAGDQIFVADILGKTAVDNNGRVLGRIDDVQNFGTADVIYIKGEKPFLFANIGGIITAVDEKQVTLNAKKLSEVMVYED